MAPDVAEALARLGNRGDWTGDDDLVFAGPVGSYMSDAALRPRYKAALKRASLRDLRFGDLRVRGQRSQGRFGDGRGRFEPRG